MRAVSKLVLCYGAPQGRGNMLLAAIALLMCPGLKLWAGAPVWPVPGGQPADYGDIISFIQPTASGTPESGLFGCQRNDGNRFHEAIDIAPVAPRRKGEATDPVVAIHDGLVMHISRIAGNSSYGRYVVIEHPGLEPAIYSLYAHLATIRDTLKPGTRIQAGEEIGIMGRSAAGYSIPRARTHLHLETGLRLTNDFEDWYTRQRFSSENQHGDYNGMNLAGWDPLDYYQAFRAGRVETVLDYIGQIPPAVMLHVRSHRYPDFLERYPQLKLAGVSEAERAGWQVILSGWGLPVSMKPLAAGDLRGVPDAGDISVVGVNRDELERYGCRDILDGKDSQWTLGKGGRQMLELLFKPD